MDVDDGPHTLRSAVLSTETSVLRSSQNSLSLVSNTLQISQPSTEVFTTKPSKGPAVEEEKICTVLSSSYEMSHLSSQDNSSQDGISSISSETMGHCFDALRNESKNNLPQNKISHKPVNEPHSEVTNLSREHQRFSVPPELPPEHCPGLTKLAASDNLVPDPSKNVSRALGSDICSDFQRPQIHPDIFAPSRQFFSFVILHVPEDEEIASRVCGVLQDLGVGNGTTFCEGFETPGISPLTCLEHAVEDSAYMLLLLTNAFLSKWGLFQANAVLMNSIDNANKSGTVIPFYARSRKPSARIPLCIRSLLPLDENSLLFESKVQRTFKPAIINCQYKQWKKNYLQQPHISVQYSSNVHNSESLPSEISGLPSQIHSALSWPYGQTPIIQINNAANVQIGNQNSILVQTPSNEPQGELAASYYFDEESTSEN